MQKLHCRFFHWDWELHNWLFSIFWSVIVFFICYKETFLWGELVAIFICSYKDRYSECISQLCLFSKAVVEDLRSMTSLSPGIWISSQYQAWFLSYWVNFFSCTTSHLDLSCPRIWKLSLSDLLEGLFCLLPGPPPTKSTPPLRPVHSFFHLISLISHLGCLNKPFSFSYV